jgi:hypothetical protein
MAIKQTALSMVDCAYSIQAGASTNILTQTNPAHVTASVLPSFLVSQV